MMLSESLRKIVIFFVVVVVVVFFMETDSNVEQPFC